MSSTSLFQLRTFLGEASSHTPPFQMQFVQNMNAALQSQAPHQANTTFLFHTIRTAAESFWKAGGVPTPQGPLASWVRWEDMAQRSGVGLLLKAPNSQFLLLPRDTDPTAIRFEPQIADHRLVLIPNLTTLENSPGGHPHYFRIESLRTRTRPALDLDFYKTFLLEEHRKGRFAPMGIVFQAGRAGNFILEDAHNGVYHAIHALQRGMEYCLCALGRESLIEAPPTVVVGGLVASYPKLDDLMEVDSTTLPPSRFFGNGHPAFKRIRVKVSEQRDLFDRDGNVVGVADLFAGGAPGKIIRPKFSAMTSNGRRLNQEDSLYAFECQLPGRPPVHGAAIADGLGGAVLGEMASSAVTQGVHAAVIQALSENRIPLPHELAAAAAKALNAQLQNFLKEIGEEVERELKTQPLDRVDPFPDCVMTIVVVIGDRGFAASTGDVLMLHCRRRPDGSVETVGHSDVDALDASIVTATVRRNQWHHWVFPMDGSSSAIVATDGLIGSLVPFFKNRTSPYIRQNEGTPRADQGAFHNINRILGVTPPAYTAVALHNVAMGMMEIPGLSADAKLTEFSDLYLPAPDIDNITGAVIHQTNANPPKCDIETPDLYRPLVTVNPLHQYFFDVMPKTVTLPADFHELFIGNAPQASGRPTLILPDKTLTPLYARLFRAAGATGIRHFLEKLTWGGRIAIKRGDGQITGSLLLKGAAAEIHRHDKIELNRRISFTFEPAPSP